MKLILRCDNVKLMSEQVVKISRNKAQYNTSVDQISRLELTHLIMKLGNTAISGTYKTRVLNGEICTWGGKISIFMK